MTYKTSVYSQWVRNTLPANSERSRTINGGDEESHLRSMTFVWGGGRDTHGDSTSDPSFIGGGQCNNVGLGGSGAPFSGIVGGQCNIIDDTGAATNYGIIGGGFCNCVCAGTNHSSIFSGECNMVTGNCSQIFGGLCNCDGGYNYVGIFGCCVTGAMHNAFHANNIVGQNIPIGTCPGGIITQPFGPTGMLWYFPDALGNNVLYVHT